MRVFFGRISKLKISAKSSIFLSIDDVDFSPILTINSSSLSSIDSSDIENESKRAFFSNLSS
ncbi:hypothetical protein DERP_009197 [Dermatophagoides pteronyssinus]|uniref:Uncharacterized protein n=1 Tax=Dermatophagoides pteronyssinus TaxID=6956 RepID=A0ABQ8JQT6_DERPT|nr:hypothetical protein DERP_009197 [Dermatophagoides pteronyssinus]